jgi:hypothetical protein
MFKTFKKEIIQCTTILLAFSTVKLVEVIVLGQFIAALINNHDVEVSFSFF